jgi:hypothetical protein
MIVIACMERLTAVLTMDKLLPSRYSTGDRIPSMAIEALQQLRTQLKIAMRFGEHESPVKIQYPLEIITEVVPTSLLVGSSPPLKIERVLPSLTPFACSSFVA